MYRERLIGTEFKRKSINRGGKIVDMIQERIYEYFHLEISPL